MASTASPSLKLELMATGDQSGTWGDTTNTNLGTLLEQAITGYISIAKVGTTDYTLTNTDYASNENRNAVIEFTGTPGGAFNVIVPNAKKLWVFKNSTPSAMTIKTSTSTTNVTVAASSSQWVYCDGSNALYNTLTGTLASQTASNVSITGGTITGLSSLTLASGAATPATNDAAALGTGALSWSDLFLAAGGVINFGNGDVTITQGTNSLAFGGASSGYTVDAVLSPSANDGAALGSGTVSWSDLFLASGGVVNFANGDVTITHSTNTLAFAGASSGYTFDVPIGLASGGTGANLTDPNADRIMFWDDSAGAVTWLSVGNGLAITTTTIDATSTSPLDKVTTGAASNTQTFNATGTWTKPNTGTYAIVYTWGGGAGGGHNNNISGGNAQPGGGGGAFAMAVFALANLTNTVTATVGAGGTSNSGTTNGAGNAGGASNFGSYTIANGGSAGSGNVGKGGNSAFTLVYGQAAGSNGYAPTVSSVTAGFAALYSTLGGDGANQSGDAGGLGFGGGGGGFINTTNVNIVDAGNSVWGGGGGGGSGGSKVSNSGTSTYGGAGAPGGTSAATVVGTQPGGGGGGLISNSGQSVGGAGKIIVYVY